MMEKTLRWAVEARRERKRTRTGARQDSTFQRGGTGRGSAGLIRGRDERRPTDETSRTGKEKGRVKGSAGKAEHEGKGGLAGKGEQQSTRTMRNEEEEKLEEHEDEKQKKREEEKELRSTGEHGGSGTAESSEDQRGAEGSEKKARRA